MRQLASASAAVTLARAYEPFGDPLLTTGSSIPIYGFAGEQRDGTGLVFLRARYYGPSFGRFLSRDIWEGDPNQPMSYNLWLYAFVNPIRLIDPRGLEPCDAQTSGSCILSAARYGGVAHDIGHFRSSWAIGTSILSSLGRVRDTQQPEVFPVTESQVSLGPLHRYLYSFSRTYWASIPSTLSNREIARVGLGIFMDFQYGLEAFQRFDPRCWMVPPVYGGSYGHCSSFSNEDLPSDYLGYVAAAQGHSLANALSITVEALGGGEHATHRNPIYSAASRDQMFMCSVLPRTN